MTAETDTQAGRAAEFVAFFAAGWRIGAGGGFAEHFAPRLAPNAVLEQPLLPRRYGPDGLRELFEPLFRAIPDLRGDVVRWGATTDGVLIELNLHGTLGGRPIEWTTIDRIVLDQDGRVVARKAHFDPLPLLGTLLRRPRVALDLLRPGSG